MAIASPMLGLAFSFGARLLLNLLFPPPGQTVEGPRQSDLSVSGSSYGAGIPKAYNRCRVTCSLIWAAPIREQQMRTTSGGKGGGPQVTQVSYSYFGYFAYLIAEGQISNVLKIWLNGELQYNVDTDADPQTVTESNEWFNEYCTFYPGTYTQGQDPTIVSFDGAENTPAYRGRSYLVFNNLPLDKYSGRAPSISILIQTPPFSLAQIITDICTRAGLPSGILDFSGLPSVTVIGFLQSSPTTARALIESLQTAYMFSAVESSGELKFQDIYRPLVAVIPANHLATRDADSERPVDFVETRQQETELPYEIRVNYYDPEEDYAQKVQYARRESQSLSINRNVSDFNLQIVMSASYAATLATKLLHLAISSRNRYQFDLPPEWIWLDPGDVCELAGRAIIEITKVEVGANRLIKIEAVSYDGSGQGITVTRPPSFNRPTVVRLARHPRVEILDIPLLADNDFENGLYVAALGNGTLLRWRDSALTNLKQSYLILGSTVIGETTNTLGSPRAVSVPDFANTVTIEIERGELESINEQDWLSRRNLALIGNELICYRFATLTAPRTYILTNLMRGLYGTEAHVGSHTTGERFVLLRNLTRLQDSVSDINVNYWWQLSGGGFGDPNVILRNNTGESLKPYAPVHVRGVRDSSGNLTISWVRRTRILGEWMDYTDVPLGESVELYQLQILNLSHVPIRTVQVSAPTWTYLASTQIADGWSLGDSIPVRVRQINNVIGPGKPAQATL